MSLPKLPGYCFDQKLGTTKHPRIQILDRLRDTPYTYYDDKIRNPVSFNGSRIPGAHRGEIGPKWLVFEKKVLNFDGYWLESVKESPMEQYRTRNCKVLFYLEDDTIQVLEPRIRDSGLAQGVVLNRRRVMKQPPDDAFYYTVDDLNIGEIVYLGARSIKLISCDKFTENMLRRFGKKIQFPIEPPENPIDKLKKQVLTRERKGKGFYIRRDNLACFLDHNKHILRFFCFWNNEESTTYDPRSMILYYFIEDDTIQINEKLQKNGGREGSLFLKRQKLPKLVTGFGLNFPSNLSDPGYLNVIRASKFDHKIVDSGNIEDQSIPCYTESDLTIGQYVNVFGRKFLICDCDEFTKEYYKVKYGIENMNSINMSQYWNDGKYIQYQLPPYNGWGSEEDSKLNCLSIRPEEVVKDNRNFFKSKKKIDDLLTLTFLIKIANPTTKFDETRRFVLFFRLEDEKLRMNEFTTERKGSKYVGFINRCRLIKPKSEWTDENNPEYYTAKDFYIGSKFKAKGHIMEVILVDDYSLSYMERRSYLFPYSSIYEILQKILNVSRNRKDDVNYFFLQLDPSNTGFINFDQLKLFKSTFLDEIINFQELVTLARHFTDRSPQKELERSKKMARIRRVLRNNGFLDYYRIKEMWYDINPFTSSIHKSKAWSIFKGMKFPLSDELLCDLLALSAPSGDPDLVDVCKLLDIIEWQKFQPDYYNRIGQYLDCDDDVVLLRNLKHSEMFPNLIYKIGNIEWKRMLKDIYNPPVISANHPSTQRAKQTKHCIEAY